MSLTWRFVAPAVPLLLSGCAIGPMPSPTASIAVVDRIAAAALPPLAIGIFVAGPGLPPALDRALTIRASTIRSIDGSFSRQLGATLAAQLRAAGRLDPGSAISVGGALLVNAADSAVGTAHARLTAEFVVTRDGRETWRKIFTAERSWDSSVIGAQAIPAADANYGALYPELIARLIDDPGFRAAVRG